MVFITTNIHILHIHALIFKMFSWRRIRITKLLFAASLLSISYLKPPTIRNVALADCVSEYVSMIFLSERMVLAMGETNQQKFTSKRGYAQQEGGLAGAGGGNIPIQEDTIDRVRFFFCHETILMECLGPRSSVVSMDTMSL